MHDHSIGIVAAQVKTSSSELPLIDRLSALTVAIIDGASSKVVKKHQLTQQLDWNGMSNNTL
jgi:hypothetical protein